MSIFVYVFQSDDKDIYVGLYIFYTFYGLVFKNTGLNDHKGVGIITLVNELVIWKPEIILFSCSV